MSSKSVYNCLSSLADSKETEVKIVRECPKNFGFELLSVILDNRCSKFVSKYIMLV